MLVVENVFLEVLFELVIRYFAVLELIHGKVDTGVEMLWVKFYSLEPIFYCLLTFSLK